MIEKIFIALMFFVIVLGLINSCAYNQIMLNDTHGTASDVGDETSSPTENTTANPQLNIPAPSIPLNAPK